MHYIIYCTVNTVRDARKEFGNVSKVLKGIASQTKGFKFKYLD